MTGNALYQYKIRNHNSEQFISAVQLSESNTPQEALDARARLAELIYSQSLKIAPLREAAFQETYSQNNNIAVRTLVRTATEVITSPDV